jgi:hypothetical protein
MILSNVRSPPATLFFLACRALGRPFRFCLVVFGVLLINVGLGTIPLGALESCPNARFPFFSLVPWIRELELAVKLSTSIGVVPNSGAPTVVTWSGMVALGHPSVRTILTPKITRSLYVQTLVLRRTTPHP